METRPKTIFIDIDGTIFYHYGTQKDQIVRTPMVLSGVHDALHKWEKAGHHIVLTTARKEGSRKLTEIQLEQAGIVYDQLVMGITGGVRVLINDLKKDSEHPTAIGLCVPKNEGLDSIDI